MHCFHLNITPELHGLDIFTKCNYRHYIFLFTNTHVNNYKIITLNILDYVPIMMYNNIKYSFIKFHNFLT